MKPAAFPVPMPDLTEETGPSGLRMVAAGMPTVPLLQADLAVRVPVADYHDLAVLDVLTASWPDSPPCAEWERLGGQVAVTRIRDWLVLSLLGPAGQLEMLTRTIAQTVASSEHGKSALNLAISKASQQAQLAAAQPAVRSHRAFLSELYPDPPPVLDVSPPPAELKTVTAEEVAERASGICPGQSALVVVGDLPEQAFAEISRSLRPWTRQAGQAQQSRTSVPVPVTPRQPWRHTEPGWQQSHIRLGASAASPADDAFPAEKVAACIFGGFFTSRLMTSLREDRGIAYRVDSSVRNHLTHGVLAVTADVASERAAEAAECIAQLMDDYARTGPSQEEVRAATRFMTGISAISLTSQTGLGNTILSYVAHGLPLADISDLPARIGMVDLDQVAKAAQDRFPSERFGGVVCGAVES